MEPEDQDDDLRSPLLHPDDRLWRHPSEVGPLHNARVAATAARPTPWSVGILSGSIGALLVAGTMSALGGLPARTVRVTERVAQRVAQPAAADLGANSIPAIAARVRPAIAQISVSGPDGNGSGSGVVFRSDGHVLTNDHVVAGASSVTVILADGRGRPARVVGSDPDTDVAVLKIDGTDLPTAVLGSAEDLRVGQAAIAVGSPLGMSGGPSVSVGVVSGLQREVAAEGGRPLLDMIQTDARIGPGSSGGALLDSRGAVIGITTAIAVDSATGIAGLGFATPIDIARDVAAQLIETGRVIHVWLGIEGEDVNDAMSRQLGVGDGALVRRVSQNSPAARAGLAAGDVISHVEGRAVTTMAALVVRLRTRKPGQMVTLKVLHLGKWSEVRARLAPRPTG